MLAPWKKSYDQPRQHIKKQRHYFANKGPSSQSYGFSSGHVWMWELDCEESWVPKNWCFELWCWRRLLRVPWTARRSNQSILKEISPGCSFEGLMLKLKLQHFGHLMWRTNSLEDTLMLGKTEGGRKGKQSTRCWMASLIQWTWVWASSRSWWWTERPGVLQSMGSQRVRHDWTELNWIKKVKEFGNKGGTIKKQSAVIKAGSRLLLKGQTDPYLWVLLKELRSPPTWRMVTSCWVLEHLFYLASNQREESHTSYSPHPKPIKTFHWRPLRGLRFFEHEPLVLLAWPFSKPLSAPNSALSDCLASLCIHWSRELLFHNTCQSCKILINWKLKTFAEPR